MPITPGSGHTFKPRLQTPDESSPCTSALTDVSNLELHSGKHVELNRQTTRSHGRLNGPFNRLTTGIFERAPQSGL